MTRESFIHNFPSRPKTRMQGSGSVKSEETGRGRGGINRWGEEKNKIRCHVRHPKVSPKSSVKEIKKHLSLSVSKKQKTPKAFREAAWMNLFNMLGYSGKIHQRGWHINHFQEMLLSKYSRRPHTWTDGTPRNANCTITQLSIYINYHNGRESNGDHSCFWLLHVFVILQRQELGLSDLRPFYTLVRGRHVLGFSQHFRASMKQET